MGFIKIGGAALNQTPFDWENNCKNIKEAIGIAQKKKIEILCLPELCISGYGCEDMFLSSWLSEKAIDKFLEIVPFCSGLAVAIGFPMIFEQRVYNCTALVQNAEILGIYVKQFLANEGVHYEPRWFSSWPEGIIKDVQIGGKTYKIGELIFEINEIRIGFEICEDAWVADEVRPAARHVRKGIDLILNPSASHFAFAKSEFRYKLISGSSEKFNCTYLYTNLLGNEAGRMIYDGEVLIYHKGDLIQRNDRFSFKNVNIVSAEVDFEHSVTKHETLTPDKREREFEFWEATTLGLFDYLRKSKSKGFTLSLSGGADSSTCALMIAEMVKRGINELGIHEFLCKAGLEDRIRPEALEKLTPAIQVRTVLNKLFITAYQATEHSGEDTFKSAESLAKSIGAVFYHWNVDKPVNDYIGIIETAIGRSLNWQQDDITLQNIQARSRAPAIWMLANIYNFLLITTSNRSEGDVGYATMDGDTAGSLAPIAGVNKDFIRKWLLWAEKNLDQPGLKIVNQLTPTAELRPEQYTQTDEADLMPYAVLAKIEYLAIKEKYSPLQIFLNLKNDRESSPALLRNYIVKFFRLWTRNQWKRERIAPSFHLDVFNVDPRSWMRFPILSGGFEEDLKLLEDLNINA